MGKVELATVDDSDAAQRLPFRFHIRWERHDGTSEEFATNSTCTLTARLTSIMSHDLANGRRTRVRETSTMEHQVRPDGTLDSFAHKIRVVYHEVRSEESSS